MSHCRGSIVCLTLLTLLACCAPAVAEDRTVTLESLLDEMTDVTAVARWPQPEYKTRLESSYDRRSKTPADANGWFANTDNMDQPTNAWKVDEREGRFEWVLMDAAGPGCVVRFWAGGHPAVGTVRFYLDGAEKPAIAEQMGKLLGGQSPLAPQPLGVKTAGDATNLYLPIPYAKSCKITYEQGGKNAKQRPPGRWYNIEYRTYAPGTKVETFTAEAHKKAQAKIEASCKKLLDPPTVAVAPAPDRRNTIEPGKQLTIEQPMGTGVISTLELQLLEVPADRMEQVLRSLVLVGEFDGEQTLWCPLGEFFGTGVGLNSVTSWYRTVTKDGVMTCRWPMPFKKSARLSLLNCGPQKVGVKWRIDSSPWTWDDRSMHFHCTWRLQQGIRTRPFSDFNYVNVTGRGVYLGDTLALYNPAGAWWGEGDEKILVDGESFPSFFGTGSEDYYGYAWGNPALFQSPFLNQPRAGAGNRGYTTNTRTRSLDAIPFDKSIQVDIEIWHWADCKVDYSVASYWYARPGAKSNRTAAPEDAARPLTDPTPAPAAKK